MDEDQSGEEEDADDDEMEWHPPPRMVRAPQFYRGDCAPLPNISPEHLPSLLRPPAGVPQRHTPTLLEHQFTVECWRRVTSALAVLCCAAGGGTDDGVRLAAGGGGSICPHPLASIPSPFRSTSSQDPTQLQMLYQRQRAFTPIPYHQAPLTEPERQQFDDMRRSFMPAGTTPGPAPHSVISAPRKHRRSESASSDQPRKRRSSPQEDDAGMDDIDMDETE